MSDELTNYSTVPTKTLLITDIGNRITHQTSCNSIITFKVYCTHFHGIFIVFTPTANTDDNVCKDLILKWNVIKHGSHLAITSDIYR